MRRSDLLAPANRRTILCLLLALCCCAIIAQQFATAPVMTCDSMMGSQDDELEHFRAYRQEALRLISDGQLLAALEMVKKMGREADSMMSHSGIFETMVVVGDIYRIRDDQSLAAENYHKALEYQQKYLPEVNPALLYAYLAEYYRRKSGRTPDDIDRSKHYVEEGLRCADTDYARALLLIEKGMSHYAERDTDAFNAIYVQCDSLFGRLAPDPKFIQLQYRKAILDNDYERAKDIAMTLPNQYDRQAALYVIHRAKGDYRAALRDYESANHLLNAIREQERRSDLAEISAHIGNYQLQLANHILEQQRIQADNARHRTFNTALTLLCVVFLALLVTLYWSYRRVREANRRLAQNNAELVIARNQAMESEKMKTLFIQNINHEIRTPLNAIIGFAMLLSDPERGKQLGEKRRNEFRELIAHNSDMLTTLVDDLLTISDLESGKYEFTYDDVVINQLCRCSIESVRSRAKAGVDINFSTEVPEQCIITTDQVRVAQVLNNFLVNACKYTDQGTITVSVRRLPDGYMQVAVTDTGQGIPADKATEIFERFTKLDAFGQGPGLGLHICQVIAERLGARLYLDTTYRAGARFVIELPPAHN